MEAFFEDADCLFDLGTNNEQVYALSSLIGIPVIMMNSITSDIPYDLTLSMMPSTTTIAKALLTLTTYYRFKDIAVVYDGEYIHVVYYFCSGQFHIKFSATNLGYALKILVFKKRI